MLSSMNRAAPGDSSASGCTKTRSRTAGGFGHATTAPSCSAMNAQRFVDECGAGPCRHEGKDRVTLREDHGEGWFATQISHLLVQKPASRRAGRAHDERYFRTLQGFESIFPNAFRSRRKESKTSS